MAVTKVALISTEGMEFVVDRRTAMASASLRELILNSGEEAFDDGEKVVLRVDAPSRTLERLCRSLCRQHATLGQARGN